MHPAKSSPSTPSPPVVQKGAQETASQDPPLPRRTAIGNQAVFLPVPRLTVPIAIAPTDQFAVRQEKPATKAQRRGAFELVCPWSMGHLSWNIFPRIRSPSQVSS